MPEHLFCFYEGKDDPRYYNPRIRSIVFKNQNVSIKAILCDGKDNVLGLLSLLEEKGKYSKANAAFFIDRDFDPPLPDNSKLYVTPCYSFENLYVTKSTLGRILQDEFGLNEDDTEHLATINLFEQQLSNFLASSRRLHSWIYWQRQKEWEMRSLKRLNIGERQPDSLFKVGLHFVTLKLSFEDFITSFPNAYQVSEQELITREQQIAGKNEARNARGKYIIFFFKEFLKRLVDDRRAKDKRCHFQNAGKVDLNISNNIVSEIAQYADTPECLQSFLERLAIQVNPQSVMRLE